VKRQGCWRNSIARVNSHQRETLFNDFDEFNLFAAAENEEENLFFSFKKHKNLS